MKCKKEIKNRILVKLAFRVTARWLF